MLRRIGPMPVLTVFVRRDTLHAGPIMTLLHHALPALLEDESGQDMTEYALVASLVGLGAVAALKNPDKVLASIAAIADSLAGLV